MVYIDVKDGSLIPNSELIPPSYNIGKNSYEINKLPYAKIPFWEETLLMLRDACKVIPDVHYIGWDVGITAAGPLLIEGNNSFGQCTMELFNATSKAEGSRKDFKEILTKNKINTHKYFIR